MYKVITTGGMELGVTEHPQYVRKQPNGIMVLSGSGNGITFDGTIYHLDGKPALDGYETVFLVKFDGAKALADTQTTIVQQQFQLATAENAMCESDTAIENRFTSIENALCEMDSAGAESEGME
ncbi:hypothetical protein OBV_22710 [Oscillibacter valericigenes Sjm18-20]|nr:hypothetical protein OBV_22710 [Oscillibacter valericigenes Sjm18-20]